MKIPFQFQGQQFEADAQYVKGQLWIHVNGRTFVHEGGSKKATQSKGSSQKKTGDVSAPMPGKVTKILKNKGELVKAGEMVLVMEAMKMEYSLKADVDGVIEAIHCQVGDQVALGKLLAKIKQDL